MLIWTWEGTNIWILLCTFNLLKPSDIQYLSSSMTELTKWPVHPAKTQISLGICPVWSVFAVRFMGCEGPILSSGDSEDSNHTGWMPRRIWVFTGRKAHFVGFVMLLPICVIEANNCKVFQRDFKIRNIKQLYFKTLLPTFYTSFQIFHNSCNHIMSCIHMTLVAWLLYKRFPTHTTGEPLRAM